MSAPSSPSEALRITSYIEDDPLIEATRSDGEPHLRVYSLPRTAVVLGRGSKPDLELRLEACARDGVPVQRRRGGGCAVVVDPGNVIVSLVLAVSGLGGNLRHFERISGWIISALSRLDIEGVHREGPSDLVLEDRKIGGACIYRSKGLLYYSTTILVDPEVPLMERYLHHPPREPAYRRGRPHAEFVGALRDRLGSAPPDAWLSSLRGELRLDRLGIEPGELES